jgi:hypothetical protein
MTTEWISKKISNPGSFIRITKLQKPTVPSPPAGVIGTTGAAGKRQRVKQLTATA